MYEYDFDDKDCTLKSDINGRYCTYQSNKIRTYIYGWNNTIIRLYFTDKKICICILKKFAFISDNLIIEGLVFL